MVASTIRHALEGSDNYQIPCSCYDTTRYEPDVIHTADCLIHEGHYWKAPHHLADNMGCGIFIGWVCPTGNAHTGDCWKPYMTVGQDKILTIKYVEKNMLEYINVNLTWKSSLLKWSLKLMVSSKFQ